MSQTLYIEPLDILFLRDNHLFGASGDSSRSLMPPWPSVFAGAIRSRMLADADVSIDALKNNSLPAPLDAILGMPEVPGTFTLGSICLAQNTAHRFATYHPLPADLVVTEEDEGPILHKLQPQALPAALMTSSSTPQLPILRTDKQLKPASGYWLNQAGWQAYLSNQLLKADQHLIHQSELWQTETRLGIALDEDRRSTRDGALYTSDAINMAADTGFCVTVHGADDALPQEGLLRLGGDGRGAHIQQLADQPAQEPDWTHIQQTGRFRLILTSPGIFPTGSQIPGYQANGFWQFNGLTARQVSQAVPRHQVISGWDMANHIPKTAERCVPAGAVYWFEDFDGEINQLQKLLQTGLWDPNADNDQASRRAEGFNRIAITNA